MAKGQQVQSKPAQQPTTTTTTTAPAATQTTATPVNTVTVEQVNALPDKEQGAECPEALELFGTKSKSDVIRGMSALGLKPGPISKKLGIRYQHARNVLKRPLKRVIAEQKAQEKAAPAGQTTAQK